MTGGITEMRNTRFEHYEGPRLPREVQLQRLQRVIQEELTAAQREVLLAYYVHRQSIPKIAKAQGVYKSTVSRTLKRAENNVRKYLKY